MTASPMPPIPSSASGASPGEIEGGAIFDPTQRYRYLLWRRWDLTLPAIAFLMLNPSTADAQVNDATIRRCIQFAQSWGYGGLEVVNLFAWRATHPRHLRAAIDPVGADCDAYVLETAQRSARVVVAWGNGGSLQARDQAVIALLRSRSAMEAKLYCLGLNQTGQPRHPLYIHRGIHPLAFSPNTHSRSRALT